MVEKLDLLEPPSSKILTFLTKIFDLMLEISTHANLPKGFSLASSFNLTKIRQIPSQNVNHFTKAFLSNLDLRLHFLPSKNGLK